MLCAFTRQGHEVLSTQVWREDGPFFCPACRRSVILKKGRVKIPHFAHTADTPCSFTGQGESEEHRLAKMTMYQELLKVPGVSDVRLERVLHEVRPDVSFLEHGSLVAIEVQISSLSPDDVERRTTAYAKQDIAVLWTPPLSMSPFEERYAPRDWERYLHGLYYGQVLYWSHALVLQPVAFEPYFLSPSWYSSEKRSKRFVTPSFRPCCLVSDLVPHWRRAWYTYPRAKLYTTS